MTNEADPLEQLAAELKAVLDDDAPPAVVLAAAHAAWEWRTIDAELAELCELELAALRSDQGLLTLAVDDVFVDLDLVPGTTPERTAVIGQITSSVDVTAVTLEIAGDPAVRLPVAVDGFGGFRVETAISVGARVVLDLADGRRVVGTWLTT